MRHASHLNPRPAHPGMIGALHRVAHILSPRSAKWEGSCLREGATNLAGSFATAPRRSARSARRQPQYRRTERSQGQFYWRFVLPDTVDSDKVNATGKDGVLTVTIPKQAKAMPRRIQIGE
jgi:hypothetical protein